MPKPQIPVVKGKKLIFCIFIYPLFKYIGPVWHFAMMKDENEEIEQVQKRSQEIIYRSFHLAFRCDKRRK